MCTHHFRCVTCLVYKIKINQVLAQCVCRRKLSTLNLEHKSTFSYWCESNVIITHAYSYITSDHLWILFCTGVVVCRLFYIMLYWHQHRSHLLLDINGLEIVPKLIIYENNVNVTASLSFDSQIRHITM